MYDTNQQEATIWKTKIKDRTYPNWKQNWNKDQI